MWPDQVEEGRVRGTDRERRVSPSVVIGGSPTELLQLLFSVAARTLSRFGLGHGHPQSSFQVPAGPETTIPA
jgi:hypothetical protein